MSDVNQIQKILKKKKSNKKKRFISKLVAFMLFPTILIGISLSYFSPKADVYSDNTEIIEFTHMLEKENFSIQRSKEILSDVYSEKYSIRSTNNEIIIGVYLSNGEVYIIERVQFPSY